MATNVRRVGKAVPAFTDPVDDDKNVVDPDSVVMDDMLSAVRRDLAEENPVEPLVVNIPRRPQFKLMFYPEIEYDDFQLWMKKATKKLKGGDSEINQLQLAHIVLSRTNIGVLYNGKRVRATDGAYLTLAHHELHDMLDVPIGNTVRAIKQMFLNDGHTILACNEVVEKAGYTINGDVSGDDEDDPLEL